MASRTKIRTYDYKHIINVFIHHFIRFIPFMISFIGLAMILTINLEWISFEDTRWNNLISNLGTGLLTGGIFSVVFKIFRFFKFFSDELTSIIYEYSSLEKHKDLSSLWRETSAIMCGRKFPELKDELYKTIEDAYLPKDHDFYRKHYNLWGYIEFDSQNPNFIIYKEHIRYIIKINDSKKNANIRFSGYIHLDPNETENCKFSYNKIESIYIDKKALTDEYIQEKYNQEYDFDKRKLKYEFQHNDLMGKEKYIVEIKTEKKYSIQYNPEKNIQFNRICKNLRINIQHPQNLTLKLVPAGTLYEFEDDGRVLPNILSKRFFRIILPYQGCTIIMTK